MRILPCLCLLALSGCVSISFQLGQSTDFSSALNESLPATASLQALGSPPRAFARPTKPAWELLQAAAERAGLRLHIDIAAPNPRVTHPDELLPRTPASVLMMYPTWNSMMAARFPHLAEPQEHTWWRQVIAGICIEAGLSFKTTNGVLSVRRASGLGLSRFVRAGLVEGRFDADWRNATVEEAMADLQSLFPSWTFHYSADEERLGARLFHEPLARCAIDVADWQLAYLFAWWAGFECSESNSGFEFTGGTQDWQSHSGIRAGARLYTDGRTGEVLRPPK